MSVPVRAKPAPINRAAFMAALSASGAWAFWPSAYDGVFNYVAAGLCAGVALPAGLRAGVLYLRDYTLRRNLARAEEASTDHGTARMAEWSELVARFMHDPASGNFLGMYEGRLPAFAPPRNPFSLNEMPPGVGKTVNYVIPSILHQARLGKSLFIPDVKTELAPMLVAALRGMGVEVWCLNPAKAHLDLCGDTELNLYQPVLDAYHSVGAFRADTIKIALDLAELHLPEAKGGDQNVYFRNGSRRCIGIAILSQAALDSARCTPSDVFALLNDPAAFKRRLMLLKYEIERLFEGDPIAAFLRGEAANLLDRLENNPENAAAFLEGATQTLLSFNQGGRMAGYGRTATHSISTLRKRQVVLFVMSPLSHTRDFAPVVSLLNYGVMEAAKRDPAGHPLHLVGEESLNYRFNDLAADMETMRGLKLSADLYIQSYSGLERKLGKDAAASVESYCDVKIYAGLTSYARAKHVSDMLAEATIRRQDYSFGSDATDINVSSKELGRRVMTPDEILAMPRNEAWVFVRGMRPMRLTMTHYGTVTPWRDEVAANPLEASALRGDETFRIAYAVTQDGKADPKGRPTIEGVTYPKDGAATKRRRFVAPVRLRHLAWLPPLLALWLVDVPAWGTPHLRFSATYTGTAEHRFYRRCDYVGLHSRAVHPPDGRCPLVLFFPAN